MSQSKPVSASTVACALTVILNTAILTGLFSMMLAVAQHPTRCPYQAEANEEHTGNDCFPDELTPPPPCPR